MDHAQEVDIGQHLMLAFVGDEPPARILEWIKERKPAGFTLFRAHNVKHPAQIRALTGALQATTAEAGAPPLLIAADQEGGQYVALGEHSTEFPGNMALGATRDATLARRMGEATGRELAALGININYGPVCDVHTNPDNPDMGVRAFGDEPELVAEMAAAMITGIQSAGVAATAKHFPGGGDASVDPHFGLPESPHTAERLASVELRPFEAAIGAGVRLIMSAHLALPAITGRSDLPATLSSDIMTKLLRERLEYEGLLITDALDMEAISQGTGQIVDAIAAIRAGADLLLLTDDPAVQKRVYTSLRLALSRGLIDIQQLSNSNARLLSLRHWLSEQPRPDLDIVGCDEHRQLAQTIAQRSITLVRDEADLLPLRLEAESRIAAIMPSPADLTPADTSSYVKPGLAQALREYHPHVDEFVVPQRPQPAEIVALRDRVLDLDAGYNLLVIGTISSHLQPEQAALVNELLSLEVPAVTIALRTPYDLIAYPKSPAHICTYSILPVCLQALAAALWGEIPFQGQLPVRLSGF